MRPIDADRLKDSISQTVDILEQHEDDVVTVVILKAMAETFLKVIDRAPTLAKQKYDCNHDCDALHEAYKKGREDVIKEIKEEIITLTRGQKT